MKSSLGTILVLFLIVGLAACSTTKGKITGRDADPAAVQDLAGEYAVNGMDGAGSEYGGRLSIRPGDAAGHYRLQWIVNESVQEGAGAVEEQADGDVAEPARPVSPNARGVATYIITDKGELTARGRWMGPWEIGKRRRFRTKRSRHSL